MKIKNTVVSTTAKRVSSRVLVPRIFSAFSFLPAPICMLASGAAPIPTKAAKAEMIIKMGNVTPRPVSANAPVPVPAEKDATLPMQVRMLRRGMEGGDVKTLQAALIAYGFSCGAAGADGDFGSGTEAALKKFQTKYGLGADGIAGRGTWGKLLGV